MALLMAGSGAGVAHGQPATPAVRALHERLIVLDTHMDTPALFSRPGWSFLDRHSVADGVQVDVPRMIEGGVDGGMLVVFTPQGPRDAAGHERAKQAAAKRLAEIRTVLQSRPDTLALALTPDGALSAAKAGKRFFFISVENSYPLGRDLSQLAVWRNAGVRMVGPIHFLNNELGDSSTDPKGAEWGGLSPLGRRFVAEANRLGLVIDPSHASDAVLDQILELSTAPVILSHTGLKAIYDHPRNIDDTRLKALAAKGGVIQMNAYSAYMVDQPVTPARAAALKTLADTFGPLASLPPERREAFLAARRKIDAEHPLPQAKLSDLVAHIMHAVRLVGADHVGVSGDFDGGGGVEGFDEISDFPDLTAALLAAGLSDADIGKIMGGNVLRVMGQVQAKAQIAGAAR
jgi:membrane dipeptidase